MTDETNFLNAIRATPRDQVLRLVYADWLDDRGDPRGELVRIEEAIPAFLRDYMRNGEGASPDEIPF
jgi:uncharacterized protein (TIGR02996 family)